MHATMPSMMSYVRGPKFRQGKHMVFLTLECESKASMNYKTRAIQVQRKGCSLLPPSYDPGKADLCERKNTRI